MTTDSLTINGLQFSIETEHDADAGAPWDECEGHGPVREVRANSCTGYPDKRPGERMLTREFNRGGWAYDHAEAMRIAKRDAWGLSDDNRAKLAATLGREPTAGEVTAAAVEADFDYLQGWCNDAWRYVVVTVTLLDVDGNDTDETESLGRVEDSSDEYIVECATELASELAHRIGDADTITHTSRARSETIRVREQAASA